MNQQIKSITIRSIVVLFVLAVSLNAQLKFTPKEPKKKDKCPVCGMFVIDYPQWWCQIVYENGVTRFFDGAKDMFKFYLRPEAYGGTKKIKIAKIYVKDYYTLKWIDAQSAFYVIGSDVFGPMGRELIPLASEEDAIEFMQDHNGSKILRFNEVDWQLLLILSEGQDM